MENENILQKRMCNYSLKIEIIQMILICMAALLVPTFLAKLLTVIFGQNSFLASHSQIIVGTTVNSALIIAAMNVKGLKKIIGIITLPSISSILGGYVFQTASIYMIYMIPAIWIGNFAIVYLYKLLLLKKNINYLVTGIISVVVKVSIIFLGFELLNKGGVFPEKLVQNLQTAMGWTQLLTASIAMMICYIVYLTNQKTIEKRQKSVS